MTSASTGAFDANGEADRRRSIAFVESLSLPEPPDTEFDLALESALEPQAPAFDAGKDEAAVVGSNIVSFARGVAAEDREAIANALLIAQLVAKKRSQAADDIHQWYQHYFEVLGGLG
ncbi:hypothetical protein [Azospirillum sp. TSO35-2]|uniref:hypothetical protein n=1 Tax=Azospirillum sp. TSO35-2 TaxID=716796 RepID=UPI000D61988B|nr:hypothetical protein [Azospirillum sp. TSO35-2]PWC39512.1 hypothetical protein TSO352_05055 [Azospirillum sp. TSO35-2]